MPKQQQQDYKELEKEEKQEAKTSSVAITTTRKRVLVIDDEKDIAEIFRIGLKHKGFEVVDVFNEPSHALENFKPSYYDIVISDVRMHEMSGF